MIIKTSLLHWFSQSINRILDLLLISSSTTSFNIYVYVLVLLYTCIYLHTCTYSHLVVPEHLYNLKFKKFLNVTDIFFIFSIDRINVKL